MSDTSRSFRILPVHVILALAVATLALGLYSAMQHTGGHKPATGQESWQMENLRAVGDAMRAYAQAHGGSYPDGATSTEVFNALIAEGLLEDHRRALVDGIDNSSILSVVHGVGQGSKTNPETTRLLGEGIAWDVTAGLRADETPEVPLVYSTGFNLTYTPGARPIPEATTQSRLVYVYTNGGEWRIYRLDDEANWEMPFIPGDLTPDNGLRQLRPVGEAAPSAN